MKKLFILTVLTMLLLPTFTLARDHFSADRPPVQNPEQQFRFRHAELEMENRRAEFEFEQQLRELELNKRRLELGQAERRLAFAGAHKDKKEAKGLFFLICLVIHILLAVWVFKDIKEIGKGSGLWIAIVLLAGLLGAIVYAIVRLGNIKTKQE
jgi:hypothetical protein